MTYNKYKQLLYLKLIGGLFDYFYNLKYTTILTFTI